jgi:8-oxo-dGTP pyrophosphatase MutT (NUDIX family)
VAQARFEIAGGLPALFRALRCKGLPRTGQQHDFFVIESVDWVNVLAVTPDEHLVMVEQYRHGSNTVELEIPGGVMDSTDRSPLETGLRELREETGYEGENGRLLADVYSNPPS